MKIYVHSGVSLDENNNFVIDYLGNKYDDLISICPPQIHEGTFGNHIYWFGYKFNDNVSSTKRTEFIKWIKGLTEPKISNTEIEKLIEYPLQYLNQEINLYKIDSFVYPVSGRSQLVQKMIEVIDNWTSRKMGRLSFELVKSLPADVKFDWNLFETENSQDKNRYNQTKRYVEEELLPKIKNLEYFSLAESVKSKYRKYLKNFLQFDENQQEKISKLKDGSNILIVDDINTTGSTLQEILRIISEINSDCRIFVYTLIGR